ncbi:TolC family outer membrane protein [Ramlibacter sp.]|uniref:TolC family outer membrane protein n=1 Tax=Ramlibacter sp. TaxID=1917967 RepID=UPI003D13A0E1
MTPVRLLPLTLALATALGAPAHAESLLELYDSARATDATWQAAKATYEASIPRAAQARAGILPSANLTASQSLTHFETNNPPTSRTFPTQNAVVSASHPLYRPVARLELRQAERRAELAEYLLTTSGQDLIIRVSQAYFDVLASQDTLAFVRAQKTAVAEQLASARRNFEVGTATITDTREAQARYDLVLAQEIEAENDLRVKRLQLDTVVGKTGAQPNPLGVPIELPAPQPASPEAWVSQAEEAHPLVLQRRKEVEIAQIETEKQKAANKPTVDLTASHSITRSPDGNATTAANIRPRSTSVNVLFAMPLFNGYLTQNRILEALALEERSRADLEAARRTVAQAVRTAYFGIVSGQGRVRALEAAEASSQSALEANRLGYQVGVRINIDVLNAQSQLFQTKRDLARARYDVLLGHLRLRQANGTLSPEDLQRLNALLAK